VTSSVTVLDRATIREVRAKVFRRQESTLADEARGLALADFEATLTGIRQHMRALVASLPETAFGPQQDDDAGQHAWAAGEIVAHACDAQTNIFGRFLRQAVGLDAGRCVDHPADNTTYPALSRADALLMLDWCDASLAEAFAAAPAGFDLTTSLTFEPLGEMQVGANLMIFAIHEDDHLGQLEDLAGPQS
jgi:hypothetical protein